MTGRPVDAALAYAANGWRVFPCHTITPVGGCTCGQPACGSAGKHPVVGRGVHAGTTDLDQVRRWWHRRPEGNIGIRTGEPSGLVVVDIDPRHGGDRAWRELQDQHGAQPTAAVTTGGGDTHLYYQHPATKVPNSAGRIRPGIDIRGDGGYVLAPPSRHASGQTYQWQDSRPSIPLPTWLRDQLHRPALRRTRPTPPSIAVGDRWADAAIRRELARVAHAPEGTRNSTLNDAAFRLGQIAGAGLADPDQLRADLVEAAVSAGLPCPEAERTSRSGLEAGHRYPRGPSKVIGVAG